MYSQNIINDSGDIKCSRCGLISKCRSYLKRHITICSSINKFCPLCGAINCKKVACKSESKLKIQLPQLVSVLPGAIEIYNSNWSSIQTGVRTNGFSVSLINVRLPTGEISNAIDIMEKIHSNQRSVYEVGLSVGVILQHKETQEFRYFYACHNNAELTTPFKISNSNDLQKKSLYNICIIVIHVTKLNVLLVQIPNGA